MIEIVNKDITTVTSGIIVHQVNCQNVMRSGVAIAISNKYPSVKKLFHDKSLWTPPERLLGYTQFIKVGHRLVVCNLFGQLEYGYDGVLYTSYEHVYLGLLKVRNYARTYKLDVNLPYNMGCDRGGAEWDVIYTYIRTIFNDVDVNIYKYKGD